MGGDREGSVRVVCVCVGGGLYCMYGGWCFLVLRLVETPQGFGLKEKGQGVGGAIQGSRDFSPI